MAGLREMLNELAHVACFGALLIKAIRLRNAEDIGGERKSQIRRVPRRAAQIRQLKRSFFF